MAILSSVCSKNRNKKMPLEVVESYLRKYFSAINFVWLDGVLGEDITDAHIDGMARFAPRNTLVTVCQKDFYELYESILISDYQKLKAAKNAQGKLYNLVELPLTRERVKGLKYKGSYINYYVGNSVVLVPIYNDNNDSKAIKIIGDIYKDRKIVSIDVTELYKHGGMLHCVTQQQPKTR